MTRVALAGLLGRKLRTALTAIAIVLGVAMVTGTFVLTDSIDKAFNSIFTDVRKGSDIVVSGKAATSTEQRIDRADAARRRCSAQVRELPDVAEAEGQVNGEAQLIGHDGKAIVFGGAPNLGFSIANGASRFNPLTLVSGTWPHGPKVVIDKSTASKKHFKVGQTIGVQATGPSSSCKISGLVKFGGQSLGGATLAGFDVPTAQKLFDKPDQFDEIAIATKSGASSQQALSEVRAILPSNAQALTGQQQADQGCRRTPTRSSRSCADSCSRSEGSRCSSAAS